MAEVQEGEEARPGIPILDIVDPSAMRVRVNANQADVEGLAPGQPARITLDSYPTRAFNGRLATLSPIATDQLDVESRPHVRRRPSRSRAPTSICCPIWRRPSTSPRDPGRPARLPSAIDRR